VDGNGQDGLLHTPAGPLLTIQVVTLPPDQEINRRIRQGETVELDLTDDEAAGWIAASIEKKRPVAARNVILALDARPFGLLTDESVLAAFRAAYPNPPPFNHIWLVGPTPARSIRLP
jgi:hypothetical protein